MEKTGEHHLNMEIIKINITYGNYMAHMHSPDIMHALLHPVFSPKPLALLQN